MTEQLQAILKAYQPQPLGVDQSYAVLLPLVWFDEEWHILYQVRSELVSQPGEVSFPGGRLETGENFAQAAIREAVEELRIEEHAIELLGEIDYLVSGSAMIRCFVGRLHIEDWRRIEPNEEVAKLFTVSLATLLETGPTYYSLISQVTKEGDFPFERLRGGQNYPFNHHTRSIPFYEDLQENLWGMTAQFTQRFVEIIRE